ncbi:hypothetical protein GCM10025787_15910 [Saccharopolyspora rosea]
MTLSPVRRASSPIVYSLVSSTAFTFGPPVGGDSSAIFPPAASPAEAHRAAVRPRPAPVETWVAVAREDRGVGRAMLGTWHPGTQSE